MLIGFFLRRIVTLALCAGSFWLGIRTDRLLTAGSLAAPGAAACAPEAPHGN
jgi:hypothetical protein